MSELSPIAVLLADHAEAKSQLAALVAETLELREEEWPQVREEVSRRCANFQHLLLHHFRREEEGLYPDVAQMVSEGAPEVDILAGFFREATDSDLAAHAILRSRLQEIAGVLERLKRPGEGFTPLASELHQALEATREVLSRHVEKEETLVFPMIARLLEAGEMMAVRDRLAAIG